MTADLTALVGEGAYLNTRGIACDQSGNVYLCTDTAVGCYDSTGKQLFSVPVENPTVHAQILDQIMVVNMKDTAQSWTLGPDATYRRLDPGPKPLSSHDWFMTNPSLSGRGSALKRVRSAAPRRRPDRVAQD